FSSESGDLAIALWASAKDTPPPSYTVTDEAGNVLTFSSMYDLVESQRRDDRPDAHMLRVINLIRQLVDEAIDVLYRPEAHEEMLAAAPPVLRLYILSEHTRRYFGPMKVDAFEVGATVFNFWRQEQHLTYQQSKEQWAKIRENEKQLADEREAKRRAQLSGKSALEIHGRFEKPK
ncbi:MAG: hypothetical protein DCC68_16725, partial [Planctomycetota bacterium]